MIFGLFLLSSQSLIAQTEKIDSLRQVLLHTGQDSFRVNTLLNLGRSLRHAYAYKEATQMTDSAIDLASKINHFRGLCRGYRYKSILFRYRDFNKDSSRLYLRKSYLLAERIGFKLGVIKSFNDLGYHYQYYETEHLDSAIYYYKRADQLNDPVIDKEEKCISLRSAAFYYNRLGNNDLALEYALRSEKQHENNYHAYNFLAIIYDDQGQSSRAIEYYLKILKVTTGPENKNWYSAALNNLAIAYVNRENYEKALDYFLESYRLDSLSEDQSIIANSLSNLGKVYGDLKRYDESLEYLQRSIALYKEIDQECPMHLPLQGLAATFQGLDNYDSARYYFKQSLTYSKKCGDIEGSSIILVFLGQIEQKKDNLQQSFEYFSKALEYTYQTGVKSTRQEAAQGLYKIHKQWGNFKKALYYHELFKENQDSLFNEKNTADIARLEADYEFIKEKEQLLADQEKEELILQNEIKRQRVLQYTALGGVILFLLLFISFYISYRRKKRANEVISSQNQKLEELSQFKEGLTHMIAHDMKNSLNTILGFSASEPFDKKMNGISQSGQVLLNLVTNMLDVQRFEEAEVSLDLKSCKIKDLVEEARLQIALLLQMKSLRLDIRVPNELTVKADSEMMVRVLVNLLNNAIKYSKPGRLITVSVEPTMENANSFCQISVTDEGEGIEPNKLPYIFDKFWKDSSKAYGPIASTGLGLTFCKLAVEAHNGEIKVTSEAGKGTTFLVILPLETSGKVLTEEVQKTHYGGEEGALILDNERALLSKLATQLRTLEVYQVGEINALLQVLEDEHIQSKWKRDIETAINQGNEETYKELLDQIG
ncbi:MAG: tetratricopeptide repeat-containing sensor histidine kinase [Reichenbachiella sp.]